MPEFILISYDVDENHQFGPGLCFYPEFGVTVRSLEKGPGSTLVRSSGSVFGERIWPNTGLAGSEF